MRGEGHDVRSVRFDIADEAAILTAFARLDADGVAIDILVNNAGIQLRKPMLELATQEWRKVIDANLTGAFIVGREAAKRMVPRGRGKIVNIGSLTSEVARATIAPYAVSKGGIKLLTRAMAAEWAAHGIQANAIGPGYMLTDMNKALIEDEKFDAWVKARTPAKRWGRPEELVGAVIFLASRSFRLRQRPDHLCRWRHACGSVSAARPCHDLARAPLSHQCRDRALQQARARADRASFAQ